MLWSKVPAVLVELVERGRCFERDMLTIENENSDEIIQQREYHATDSPLIDSEYKGKKLVVVHDSLPK